VVRVALARLVPRPAHQLVDAARLERAPQAGLVVVEERGARAVGLAGAPAPRRRRLRPGRGRGCGRGGGGRTARGGRRRAEEGWRRLAEREGRAEGRTDSRCTT
jgi:hypothetical protein